MEIFGLINCILMAGAMVVYGVRTFGKKSKRSISATPSKAVSTSANHRLVKTYIARGSDDWVDGWRFLCSCGATGTASDTVQASYSVNGKLGSEGSAVKKFIIHRNNFVAANGDDAGDHEDTIKLRKLEEEFAEWREACFCKDSNDDLLLLKHRHLDSKPITKVK